jgi:galactokinase
LKTELTSLFKEHFEAEPLIVRSPGRINIIGEHTDYNEGLVLPAAIDQYVYVAIARNDRHHIRLHSVEFDQRIEMALDDIRPLSKSWSNYIFGVVAELQKHGHLIGGFDLLVGGTLPIGAGLSSSAAIECATCEALNAVFELELRGDDIIRFAQAAEHNYAGVQCGIMDQTASVRGKKNHAILLDCRTNTFSHIPLQLNDYQIVLYNTNVKHSLASTEYNTRRSECQEAVQMIQRHHPGINSLRDVSFNMLVQYVHDPLIFSRSKFVIDENERVNKAVEYLQRGNIIGLGQLMYRSHEGLSLEYDVSCAELDWLVAAVRYRPQVAGARMMGGGFGGCTINLVRTDYIQQLTEELSVSYEQAMGRTLTSYTFNTTNGTEILTQTVTI